VVSLQEALEGKSLFSFQHRDVLVLSAQAQYASSDQLENMANIVRAGPKHNS